LVSQVGSLKEGPQKGIPRWWPQRGSPEGRPRRGVRQDDSPSSPSVVPKLGSHNRGSTGGGVPHGAPTRGFPQADSPYAAPMMVPNWEPQWGTPKVGLSRWFPNGLFHQNGPATYFPKPGSPKFRPPCGVPEGCPPSGVLQEGRPGWSTSCKSQVRFHSGVPLASSPRGSPRCGSPCGVPQGVPRVRSPRVGSLRGVPTGVSPRGPPLLCPRGRSPGCSLLWSAEGVPRMGHVEVTRGLPPFGIQRGFPFVVPAQVPRVFHPVGIHQSDSAKWFP
jgi:hypothetical protein